MGRSVDCDLYMYADDAALVISGTSLISIETSLSRELESLSVWLEENKLSLHLGKTESIVFASCQKLAEGNEMSIECKGRSIEAKDCVKYLGVNIDQDMSCTKEGTKLVSKINSKLKFLYRNAGFFRMRERKMLCSALLQSHFDYACNFWYRGVCSELKNKFQTAQNKIVRYIHSYDNRKHLVCSDFHRLNMLKVQFRVDYTTLCHMYNISKGVAPSYLSESIERSRNRRTRSKSEFLLPSVKTQGKKSFRYNGVRLWNRLDYDVRNVESKSEFKIKLKEILFDRMKREEESDYVYY